MRPPWQRTLEAVSAPAEEKRAPNWEEHTRQSNWAPDRPTHGNETSPNKTHNNAQGDREVRALQQPPNAAHAERAMSKQAPPSLYEVPANSTRAGAATRAPGGARHGGGNRAMTRQPRAGKSTLHGDVKSKYGGGGQAGGKGVGAQKGHPGAPTDKGRSNTNTQNARATPRGTRAGTPDKEEGRSKVGEATRTGNQNGGDGRACAWEAAATKGMAWPASPVATGCHGNPCSTGIT